MPSSFKYQEQSPNLSTLIIAPYPDFSIHDYGLRCVGGGLGGDGAKGEDKKIQYEQHKFFNFQDY